MYVKVCIYMRKYRNIFPLVSLCPRQSERGGGEGMSVIHVAGHMYRITECPALERTHKDPENTRLLQIPHSKPERKNERTCMTKLCDSHMPSQISHSYTTSVNKEVT